MDAADEDTSSGLPRSPSPPGRAAAAAASFRGGAGAFSSANDHNTAVHRRPVDTAAVERIGIGGATNTDNNRLIIDYVRISSCICFFLWITAGI